MYGRDVPRNKLWLPISAVLAGDPNPKHSNKAVILFKKHSTCYDTYINIVVVWYGSKSLDPTKLGLFKNDQRPWSLYLAAPPFFFDLKNHAPFSFSYRFSLLAEHVQSQWPKKELPFTLGLAAEGTRYFEMPLFGTRFEELVFCDQNIWWENILKNKLKVLSFSASSAGERSCWTSVWNRFLWTNLSLFGAWSAHPEEFIHRPQWWRLQGSFSWSRFRPTFEGQK